MLVAIVSELSIFITLFFSLRYRYSHLVVCTFCIFSVYVSFYTNQPCIQIQRVVLKVSSSMSPAYLPPRCRWESGMMPPCSAPYWTPPTPRLPPPPWAGTGRQQDRVLKCFCPSGPPTAPTWSTAPVSIQRRSLLPQTARCCCAACSAATRRFITAAWVRETSWGRTAQDNDVIMCDLSSVDWAQFRLQIVCAGLFEFLKHNPEYSKVSPDHWTCLFSVYHLYDVMT